MLTLYFTHKSASGLPLFHSFFPPLADFRTALPYTCIKRYFLVCRLFIPELGDDLESDLQDRSKPHGLSQLILSRGKPAATHKHKPKYPGETCWISCLYTGRRHIHEPTLCLDYPISMHLPLLEMLLRLKKKTLTICVCLQQKFMLLYQIEGVIP